MNRWSKWLMILYVGTYLPGHLVKRFLAQFCDSYKNTAIFNFSWHCERVIPRTASLNHSGFVCGPSPAWPRNQMLLVTVHDFNKNGAHFKLFAALWTRYLKNRWSESLVNLYVGTYLPGHETKRFCHGLVIFLKRPAIFIFPHPVNAWSKET